MLSTNTFQYCKLAEKICRRILFCELSTRMSCFLINHGLEAFCSRAVKVYPNSDTAKSTWGEFVLRETEIAVEQRRKVVLYEWSGNASHSVFHQNAHTKEKESISKKGIICLSLSLKATFNLPRTRTWCLTGLFKNLNNN